MSESQLLKVERAVIGRQDVVRGDGTLPGVGRDTAVTALGPLGPGSYDFIIPVAGGQSAIFTTRPATVTGACTGTVVPCLADGVSKNTVPPSIALTLAAATLSENVVPVPAGVQALRLTLVVPAAGLLDFTGGVLEVRTGALAPVASGGALATLSATGAALVSLPGDWSQGQTPAAATQATTTRAAVAGLRHICTSLAATLATGATAQAAAAILVLRDGATGVGAILWTKQIILPINGVWDLNVSGLNIVGTAGNAMTLEFTAAGVAGSFASVALTGHDAA
jgi:hypothetical protein